jgi:hypothetical protein
MKLLKRLLVVGLVLLLVGVAAGWLFFSPLVGTAIEKGSKYATGVDTDVDKVSASLFAGNFGIDGLTLANPPGFRPEAFVHLGSARATWKNGTLLSETIEMDEFVVENVDVNLERTDGKTNYGAILDHLGKVTGGGEEPEKKKEPSKGGMTLLIKKIVVKNVHAGLHLTGVPLASGSMSVVVPSIVIEDFRSDGDTTEIVAKVTRVLIQEILASVLKAGKDIFPSDILKDLGSGLSGLGGALGSGAEGAVKGVQDVLKGAGDLFKKK